MPGIHVGTDVRDVDPEARVAFLDRRLRGAIEAEAGENQILIAARGRPDHFFDHLRGDGAILRAEHHADGGVARPGPRRSRPC